MVRDDKFILADQQAETTVAAHDTDDVIDFGVGHPDYGKTPTFVYGKIGEAVTSAGSATVRIQIMDSADASSWAQLGSLDTGAVAKADLTQGYEFFSAMLPKGHRRYLKGVITIATAALTAGKFDIWLDPFSRVDV